MLGDLYSYVQWIGSLRFVRLLSRPTFFSTLTFSAALMAATATQAGTPGALDPTFGTGGKVFTDIGTGSEDLDFAAGIAPGGKPVVIARTDANGSFDFAIVRYTKSGMLDSTFGTGGKAITDFGTGSSDLVFGGVVLSNGKVVAVGGSNANGGSDDFAIARYNKDGTLDTTFGTGGKVLTDFGGHGDEAVAARPAAGGKLIVVGASGGDFAVARYNKDGTLDATFGTGGRVVTDLGGTQDTAEAVAIQRDGKIVVAGNSNAHSSLRDFAVVRYDKKGNLDPGFGTGGMVFTDFGGIDTVEHGSLILAPRGKIVVGGDTDATDPNQDFALARYNKDGSLDSTFGSGGKVITDLGGEEDLSQIVAQPGNKIIAVGSSDKNNPSFESVIARYNASGELDSTFGTGGTVFTGFGSGGSFADAVAVGGGKAVVAGATNAVDPNFDVSVARYLLK